MKTYVELSCAAAAALMTIALTGCNREARAANHLNSARKYYQKSDYPAAEIKYKNALAAQPGHPGALKGLGLALVRQGALLEGAEYLSEAKIKLPADDELSINFAKALLDLGFFKDCRSELLELTTRRPDHGEALLLLAEASFTPDAMKECEERITGAGGKRQSSALLGSALLAIRRGQTEIGTSLVDQVLADEPRNARALVFQCNLLRKCGRHDEALQSLRKASDIAGPRSDERGLYATLLADSGKMDQARALLSQSIGEAPDYLPNRRILARILIKAGNREEASTEVAKVLAKSPFDLEAGLLQSQLWMDGKDYTKAIELLEKLNDTFPARPNLELALGKACLTAGEHRKAGEMLDQVLVKVPGATEAILLRAGLHLRQGQPGDAIRLIEPLHAAEPTNRASQDLLAMAYQASNRTDDAVSIVRQQSKAAPEDTGILLKLGALLRSQGKTSEARELFDRVLGLQPANLTAMAQLSLLDETEGKRDASLARVNSYLKENPDSYQAHLFKAGLCYARKDHRSAEASATKCLELNPDVSAAYELLVLVQMAEGRMQAAVERLRDLLKNNPANLTARMYLGALLRELGQTNEARNEFLEVIRMDPNLAAAHNDLAYLESSDPGSLDQAWEHVRQARTLKPDDPSIADTFGWILYLRGDYRQALGILQESTQGLQGNPSALYHLAMAQLMMHQVAAAAGTFEKALASNTNFPEKSTALEQLSILRDIEHMDIGAIGRRLEASPKNIVLMVAIAEKLAAAGRPDDAARAYESALAVNPDLDSAHLGLADLYSTSLNDPDKAMHHATEARKAAPQSPRSAAMLGRIKFRSGSHEEAYNLLDEAASREPDDVGLQMDCARAAYSLGDVAKARAITIKASGRNPDPARETGEFLLLTRPDASDAPESAALAEGRLASNPADVPALMVRAAVREKKGENTAAIYQKILDIYPRFTPAGIALARVHLKDPENLDAAEAIVNSMRKHASDNPEFRSIMAIVSYRKGQFDYAAELLKELASIRSLAGPELLALGISMAETKHPQEASEALSQALQCALPESDAAKARATLAKLAGPPVK